MKRVKTEELSKLSETDLVKKLNDMRTELSMLRSKAARGTLKKELGEIKSVRRNIARTLTVQNERKRTGVPQVSEKVQDDKGETEESK
jgi:large subunit ribosomal protein L29